MKIKGLRFKNINSLKGEHQIDFDKAPFDQSKLFAITGPTGSGKSTLLDVITLSLYNKVPRYTEGKSTLSSTDLSKHGSLLSRGTKDAYTEVDYEINGSCFTSKWSVRTNRNGKLVGPKMELSYTQDQALIEGNSNSSVIDKNEEIIGLNYDQFIKSILLCQGAFDQFLKANRKERGILLEKITGVDIFRKIGAAAFDKASQEEKLLEQLKMKLGGIDLLSAEAIEELEKNEKEIDQKLLSVNEKILHIQRHLNIKNQVFEFRAKIEKTKEEILRNANAAAAFKDREEKLVKHQKLLAYKSDIIQFQSLQEEIKKNKSKQSALSSGIDSEKQKLKESELAKAQLDNELEKLINEKEKLIPIIENVRAKDKAIGESEVVLNKAKELFEQHESSRERLLQKYNARKNSLDKHIERRLLLLDKLNQNPQLEQLRIDFPLIQEKIKIVLQSQNSIIALNVEWEKVAYSLELPEFSAHNIEAIKLVQSQEKVKFKDKKALLKYDTVQAYEQALEELDNDIERYNRLLLIESQIQQLSKEKGALAPAYDRQLKQLEKVQKEYEKLDLKKQQYQLKETELSAKWEREKLERSFEELRADLKQDEPCPLCGSEHHPYMQHYEVSKDNTQEALEKVKEDLLKILQNMELNFEEKTSLQSLLTTKENRLKEIDSELVTLRKAFKKIDIKHETIALAIDDLKKRKEQYKKEKEVLLQSHEWDRASLTLDHVLYKLSDIAAVNAELEKITTAYSKYTQDYHVKEWESRFLQVIEAYQKASQEINALDLSITEDRGKLDEIEYELKEEAIRLKASQKELQDVHLQLGHIIQERKDLFGEQDPNRVSESMHQKILKEKDQLNTIVSKINTLNTGVQLKSKQVVELNKEISNNQKKYEKYNTNISKLLDEEAFNSLDDLMSSFLSEEELILLEQERENIKSTAIALNQNLKTYENQLLECRDYNSEVSIDTLNINLGKYKIDQTQLNQEKGIIFEQLRKDRTQRKQVESIAVEIEAQEKEYRRWKVLRDYIGDKEGNKFSIFAQELTLVHLIELANRRLKSLDERYVLQKYDPSKKEEDIIVLDTYQGNTRRSVKTLSGGETFMISLAMALSLSDLASQNVKIDSLFIDEGFGTLDEDALDKALNTLEQLQVKSEKMIGVISHVVALKERLGTQIQLNKGSDGFSKIEVV